MLSMCFIESNLFLSSQEVPAGGQVITDSLISLFIWCLWLDCSWTCQGKYRFPTFPWEEVGESQHEVRQVIILNLPSRQRNIRGCYQKSLCEAIASSHWSSGMYLLLIINLWMLHFIDGMNIQALLIRGFFWPFLKNYWVFKMSHFQDNSVQIHKSSSITLQMNIAGSPLWKMFVNSYPWGVTAHFCHWSKGLNSPKGFSASNVCCADPQRICAVGRELGAPFHLTKCAWGGWICSLCCAEAAMDLRVPLVWTPRDLQEQLWTTGRFLPGTETPRSDLNFHCWECAALLARGDLWRTQLCSSVGNLSWESWRGAKAKANRLGAGTCDLIPSFLFSCLQPGVRKLQVICQMSRGGLLPVPSPAVLRKCLLKEASADLGWGDGSLF